MDYMRTRSFLLASTVLHAPRESGAADPTLDDLEDDNPPADDVAADDGDDGDDGDADDADDRDDGTDDADDSEVLRTDDRRREPPADQQRDPPRRRANDEIRQLRADKQEMQRRLDEIERRQRENSAPPPQQRQQQMTPQERAAMLNTMTVEERMEFRLNEALQLQQQQSQQQLSQMRDQSDATEFRTRVSSDRRLEKYAADVEERYNRIIREGGFLPRQAILTYMLGEKVLQSRSRPGSNGNGSRVQRQRVRPSNNGGDVPTQRRRGSATAEQRLEGVEI